MRSNSAHHDTLVIQLTHNKALKLIRNLEELRLIRVLSVEEQAKPKLSEKYGGSLPTEVGEQLQAYITQSRNEWE